jgi:hypothetical protein
MAHPQNRGAVVAERVEQLFRDIPDTVERYRLLAGLLADEFDAVDREATERALELIQQAE